MPPAKPRGPPGTPAARAGDRTTTSRRYKGRFPDRYFKRGQSKGRPRWVATSACYGLEIGDCKSQPGCTMGRRVCKRTRSDKGGQHRKPSPGSRGGGNRSRSPPGRQSPRRSSRLRTGQGSPPPRRSSRMRTGQGSPPPRPPPRRSSRVQQAAYSTRPPSTRRVKKKKK